MCGLFNRRPEVKKEEPVSQPIVTRPDSGLTTVQENDKQEITANNENQTEPIELDEDLEIAALEEKKAQLLAQKQAKLAQNEPIEDEETDTPSETTGGLNTELLQVLQEFDTRITKVESFLFRRS
jgi:hypothetical protein